MKSTQVFGQAANAISYLLGAFLWASSILPSMQIRAQETSEIYSPKWIQVEHAVTEGETLRLIARKYFGVKEGWLCILNQGFTDSPNKLRPGQIIKFFAPDLQTSDLSVYRTWSPDCSHQTILEQLKHQESLESRTKETLLEREKVVPSTSKLRPRLLSANFGSGLNYSKVKQTGQSESFALNVDSSSLDYFNHIIELQWGVRDLWRIEFYWERVPNSIEISQTESSASSSSFAWQSFQINSSYRTKKNQLGLRLGLVHNVWPIANALSSSEFTLNQANNWELKMGLGLLIEPFETISVEARLHSGFPLHRGSFSRITLNSLLEGALLVSKPINRKLRLGLNWHGRFHDAEFTFRSQANTQKLFFSAAEFIMIYVL